MRICADGYIDLRDRRRVRTPGKFERTVQPMPEREAVSFLLSHAFRGHRRVVRGLSVANLRRLAMARWADSVNERMHWIDWVWRSITAPVAPPARGDRPQLIQLLRYGPNRVFPLYLVDDTTRVLPPDGVRLDREEELPVRLRGRSDPRLLDLRAVDAVA